jgi:hypothetical protein
MSVESDFRGIALASERLSLRAFTPVDAPEIFDATSLTITRFMAWDPSPSMEVFAEAWREWLLRMRSGPNCT